LHIEEVLSTVALAKRIVVLLLRTANLATRGFDALPLTVNLATKVLVWGILVLTLDCNSLEDSSNGVILDIKFL
jgi:hypothetical protein